MKKYILVFSFFVGALNSIQSGSITNAVRNINNWFNMSIHKAVDSGDTYEIKMLVRNNAFGINQRNGKGETPLFRAVKKKNIEAIKLLLEHRDIQPNIKDEVGYSPLGYALLKCKCDGKLYRDMCIIKELIEAKNININVRGYATETLLHFMIDVGSIDILQQLLKNVYIDVNNQETFGGYTPLHYAVARGYTRILNILLKDPRLDIDKTTYTSETALYLAVAKYIQRAFSYNRLVKIIKRLRLSGANPYIKDQNNEDVFDLINKIDDESKREELNYIIREYNPSYHLTQSVKPMFDQKIGFSKE